MEGFCKTTLDLQDTNRIHTAWKASIHNLIQNPLPWRKLKRHSANETGLHGESLESLLSQKRGQNAFRDFLKSEFCEENLDFWLTCQEFRTLEDPQELTRRATRIYEQFIQEESPAQVNLDFHTRDIISQNLQHPSPSCFLAAQKKIYSLMENGSFARFIQTEQYKVLFDAAPKQRSLGRHRRALRIRSTGDLIQYDSKAISL